MAWHPLGWEPVAFSEIDKFPAAVLAHHYPDVPNWGDMTKFKEWPDANIDVLVGGTPCQSFSVAGLRKGLDDPRGNLALTFLALAERYSPRWVIWENVPGVLSSNGGRDFGSFLGGLVELGYGFSYRVLDAQFFGVAQRRRRVFVVGYLGDWRRAAAVLLEPESLRGDSAPSRGEGEGAAERAKDGPGDCRWPAVTAPTLNAAFGDKQGLEDQHALAIAFDTYNQVVTGDTAQTLCSRGDTPGGNAHLVPAIAFTARDYGADATLDIAPTMRSISNTDGHQAGSRGLAIAFHPTQDVITSTDRCHALGANSNATAAIAFAQNQLGEVRTGQVLNTLNTNSNASGRNTPMVAYSIMPMNSGKDFKAREVDVAQPLMAGGPVGGNQGGDFVQSAMQVRRLTPVECERLQGFPDGYTAIPYRNKPAEQCPDGPRYKALGNSMAVPVMAWIGRQIDEVGNA